jgi:hypothetical protein
MENYNANIAYQLKKNDLKMIRNIPQVQKFNNQVETINALQDPYIMHGGAKTLQYVETGNNSTTYEPETLAVGSGLRKRRGRPRKVQGGNIWSDIGNVAKNVAPIAIPLMMAAGLPKKQRKPRKVQGGSFLGDLGHMAKSIGSTVGKEVLLPVAADVGKDMLKSYLTSGSTTGSGLKKRGRPRKVHGSGFFDDAFRGIKTIGKEVAPIAKDIAVPLATQALSTYMKGSGLKRQPTRRNLMIKQLMSKHSMTLPQASSYIKHHGLA